MNTARYPTRHQLIQESCKQNPSLSASSTSFLSVLAMIWLSSWGGRSIYLGDVLQIKLVIGGRGAECRTLSKCWPCPKQIIICCSLLLLRARPVRLFLLVVGLFCLMVGFLDGGRS